MTKPVHVSPVGIAVIHYFEQCRLRAYPDPYSPLFKALVAAKIDPYSLVSVPARFSTLSGAPWTIGWGDTGDTRVGQVITQQEADARFARRLATEFEPGVEDCLQEEPTAGEFDAFVSLVYNIGLANFRSSTALRRFNLKDRAGAMAGILMWNKSKDQVSLGLRRRRLAETLVFAGRSAAEAIEAAKRLT